MKKEQVSAEEALALVRTRHPDAEPNDGFLAQLELWGAMHYTLDEGNTAYRYHVLKQAART